MTNQPVTPVTHPDALTIWNEVWPEHRFNQPNDYVKAEWLALMSAALAERDTKLQAIQTVIHRWIDNKDLNLDSGGGMVEILNILYSRSHPTGDLKG